MSNELQIIEQNAITAAFAKRGGTDELFERIAQEARSFVPDVTTKKGRDAIGSLAMKISKSKTLIEKYGKELVAEQKAQIKLIDDDRISVVKKFDDLRNEILAPREAWEQAEKDRIAKHEHAILSIKNIDEVLTQHSSQISTYILNIENIVIDSSFEEFEDKAKLAKYETLDQLKKIYAEKLEQERIQAELEQQRVAEQERLKREHEERIAMQAAEQARIDAERKAQQEIEKAEREKRETIEREQRLIAEKEAAIKREAELKIQAEIDKQNAIEAERKRIEQQQKAEAEHAAQLEAQRKANIEHKRQIHNDILQKFIELGLNEDQAELVITAIAKNEVPHTSIKY